MKKDQHRINNSKGRDNAEWDEQYKQPAPREFIPTELGSAVYVSVEGQPPDEELLIADKSKSRKID